MVFKTYGTTMEVIHPEDAFKIKFLGNNPEWEYTTYTIKMTQNDLRDGGVSFKTKFHGTQIKLEKIRVASDPSQPKKRKFGWCFYVILEKRYFNCYLHIETPSGKKFIYDPYDKDYFVQFADGQDIDFKFKITKNRQGQNNVP